MNLEMPQTMNYQMASTNYGLSNLSSSSDDFGKMMAKAQEIGRDFRKEEIIKTKGEINMASKRRIVQVFICDPNENVPLENSLLYKGEQKLTDATDQELFFEVDINTVLKNHNEKRIKFPDKEASKKFGKDIFLEPVKIRDLKMIVTGIAEF